MATYIALLRGINVGGAHPLPMKELVAILESLGCERVRTYIQSGNAVLESRDRSAAKLAAKVSTAILEQRGFEPMVMMLTAKELEHAMRCNPFPEVETDPSKLAVAFLGCVPKTPNLTGLEEARLKNERFAIVDRCFYLWAPDGFGKSKLANRAELLLGVPMTSRNWRTVSKLWEMVAEN